MRTVVKEGSVVIVILSLNPCPSINDQRSLLHFPRSVLPVTLLNPLIGNYIDVRSSPSRSKHWARTG
jgi:hypothetical protein